MASLPQVIGANKVDLPDAELFMEEIEDYCREHDLKLFKISAATGEVVRALLDEVVRIRDRQDPAPVVFEREYFDRMDAQESEPFTVVKTAPHEFEISGPAIDKMLGYTNLESEKGFDFFQKFMHKRGIIAKLEEMHVEEGDTIEVAGIAFEYYR